ncbi:hypothetical protein BDQ12DRAFT_501938 [Crucibulum laeve]|uniref:Uncharacterized protein n=1 Tax=Crucibulum laeve TaxID=68775 RepID=A0A5C3LH41_9AGAR|nr:hypothetical protein BDQ12DRAFT_501938 [Crucibulum laeve]
MIIDAKHALPNDPTPADAPPSYEAVAPIRTDYRVEKNLPEDPPPSGSSSSSSHLGESQLSPPPLVKSPSSPGAAGKGKGRANWFTFGTSRTAREVRTTVLGLMRDLVREHLNQSPAALGILQSCSDVCASHSLSLSRILQEKSIEGHTPLYWAVVKRPQDEEYLDGTASSPDLLTALLTYSVPLTPVTILDVRHACLVTSDQRLFQRLRLSPEFSPVSAVDEMLLGGSIPPDDIEVEDVPGNEGAFAVNFEIVQFQKRMMVGKEIALEFIARGRLWCLRFSVAPMDQSSGPRPGSWCVSLSILENSPPTWIDSRLLVAEPSSVLAVSPPPLSSSTTSPPISAIQPTSSSPFSFFSFSPSASSSPSTPAPSSPYSPALNKNRPTPPLPNQRPKHKPRPTISLRLKSTNQLVVSTHRAGYYDSDRITVSLEDSLMGASLQYAGSSYIAPDEKLRARLEARLGKPEAECVIM